MLDLELALGPSTWIMLAAQEWNMPSLTAYMIVTHQIAYILKMPVSSAERHVRFMLNVFHHSLYIMYIGV